MQGELAIGIDDGMTRVAAALITDDNIGLSCLDVCDFAFSFVAPIGAYNCCYHTEST